MRRGSKNAKPARKSSSAAASPEEPLLGTSDVRTYLFEQAARMAPTDVRNLLARSAEIRAKAAKDAGRHELFHRQLAVALKLLDDHAAGECPQIPYYTVSLLAAALYYWLEPIDVIPDFIPGAGTSDDALVLAVAYQMGEAGLQRYCTWKDIAVDGLLTKPTAPPTAAGRRRPPPTG